MKDQQTEALDDGDLDKAFALDREPEQQAGPHATGMNRRLGEIHSERGQAC